MMPSSNPEGTCLSLTEIRSGERQNVGDWLIDFQSPRTLKRMVETIIRC